MKNLKTASPKTVPPLGDMLSNFVYHKDFKNPELVRFECGNYQFLYDALTNFLTGILTLENCYNAVGYQPFPDYVMAEKLNALHFIAKGKWPRRDMYTIEGLPIKQGTRFKNGGYKYMVMFSSSQVEPSVVVLNIDERRFDKWAPQAIIDILKSKT